MPNASPLGVEVKGSLDILRNDSWCGMAVVARGKHYYLLQTELRVEKLAAPDWSYNSDASDWNRSCRTRGVLRSHRVPETVIRESTRRCRQCP